jgi:hypothetical protein
LQRTGQRSWLHAFSVTANTDGKCRVPCHPGHPQSARGEPLPIPGRASHHPLRTRYRRRHVERGCLSGRRTGIWTGERFVRGGELFGHALKLWANRKQGEARAAQTSKTAPCAALKLPTLNVSRHVRTAQQTLKSWVQIPDVKLGRARYLRSETAQMLPVNISKKEREEMTHKITYDVLSRIAMLARSKGLRDFDYAVWISSSTSIYSFESLVSPAVHGCR